MVTNNQRGITVQQELPLVSTKINAERDNHYNDLVSYAQNRGAASEVHYQDYDEIQSHLQLWTREIDSGESLNRIMTKPDMGIRANERPLIETHYRGRE